MNSTVFSIIIPTYNAAKTLRQAIDSVLVQTFSQFELIIVDGKSSDGSVEIIENMSKKNPEIRFISEKDNGIYDAMNKGINLAKGEWLFFLGSDDRLFDNKVLNEVYQALDGNDMDIIYGNIYKEETGKRYDGEFDFRKLLKRNISHQSMFFNRKIFIEKGYFDIAYRSHADWDFNIRCFADRTVKTKYINITIASFAYGGASSFNDVPFLRNSLVPAKAKWLEQQGAKTLHNISEYDEWWRLIRNSRLYNESGLNTNDVKLSKLTNSIIRFQRAIPEKLLFTGVFSKIFMTISYFSNTLSKPI